MRWLSGDYDPGRSRPFQPQPETEYRTHALKTPVLHSGRRPGVAAFPTRAQIIVVPIGATTVSSGHPLDIISPNVFDPFHPKELKFTADIQPLSVPRWRRSC